MRAINFIKRAATVKRKTGTLTKRDLEFCWHTAKKENMQFADLEVAVDGTGEFVPIERLWQILQDSTEIEVYESDPLRTDWEGGDIKIMIGDDDIEGSMGMYNEAKDERYN